MPIQSHISPFLEVNELILRHFLPVTEADCLPSSGMILSEPCSRVCLKRNKPGITLGKHWRV